MESKFDYLTLTIKPEEGSGHNLWDCLNVLRKFLLLDDLFDKMTDHGRCRFYRTLLTYEDVQIKIPDYYDFEHQGVCLEFSSQGLDYFTEYLRSYSLTLKEWCQAFRSYCFKGYTLNVACLDYAMDDICRKGETPVLTVRKVDNALLKGDYRSRSRINDSDDCPVEFRKRNKKMKGKVIRGRTTNVGSRQSECMCRFYDKLAESIQKRRIVLSDVTDWTRCEFEFHDSAAIGVFNSFLDMPEDCFKKHMLGVCNGRLCFISQTDSNISRCPQKRWWAKFLNGCTARFKLPHKKPVRSAYARALNGFGKQWLPTLFTLVQCFGYNRIIIALKKEFSRQLKMGKNLYRREIIDNIIDDYNYSEKMNGFKHFLYSSGIPDFYLAKAIREQAQNYCVDFSRIVYSHSRDLEHKTFMEGQCILNGL